MPEFVIEYRNKATVPDRMDVEPTALPADVHDELSDHVKGTGAIRGLAEAKAWADISIRPEGDDGTRERIHLRIALIVEAADEAAAEAMSTPAGVLSEIADAMNLDLRLTGEWSAGQAAEQDPEIAFRF